MKKISTAPIITLCCVVYAPAITSAQTPAAPKAPANKSDRQNAPSLSAATENAPALKTPANQAYDLFSAATNAYKKIKTCDLYLAQNRMGRTFDATLAWRLPDHARLTLTSASALQPAEPANAAPLAQTVCDGTFLHEFSLLPARATPAASSGTSPVRYRKLPLRSSPDAPDAPPIVSALRRHEALLGGEALPLLLAGENPLTHWMESGRLVSVTPGGVGVVNGIPVERIVVVLRNEGVGSEADSGASSGQIGQSVSRTTPPAGSASAAVPAPVPPPAPAPSSVSVTQPLPTLPQPIPTTATTRAMAARTARYQAAQNAARLRQRMRPGSPVAPNGGRTTGTSTEAMPQLREDVVTLTLAFGQDDHLLRQASETRALWQNGRQVPVTNEATFTQIKVNPVLPDALFVFTTPPGVVLPPDAITVSQAAPSAGSTPTSNSGTADAVYRRAALLRLMHGAGSAMPSAAPAKPATSPSVRPVSSSPDANPPVAPPQNANPSSEAASAARVEISGGAGRDNEAPVLALHTAGTISLLEQSVVRHTFRLRNAGSAPLVLGTLRPSCSCTRAAFVPAVPVGGSVSLAPNQETTIEVTVDLDGLPPGPLRKMVSVYPAAPTSASGAMPASNPVAVLAMEGTIAPAVAVTPPLLNFGPVTAGEPRTLLLTADIDARLLPKGEPGSTGDVQLTPLDAALVSVSPVPASEGNNAAQAAPPPAPGTVRRQFRVAVNASAPLGSLMTRLRFVPPPGTSTNQMVAWHSGTTPVVGLVLGDVSATPTRVDFGRVGSIAPNTTTIASSQKTPDALAMQQVVLMSANEGVFDRMECVSSSPSLQVQVQAAGSPTTASSAAQPAVAKRVLIVRLLPSAPAGAFSAQVMVRLKKGQYVMLPVSGLVTAEATPTPASGGQNVIK